MRRKIYFIICDKQIMLTSPILFNCIVSVLREFIGGLSLQHTKTTNRFSSGYCLAVYIMLCVTAEIQMGPFWICRRDQIYHINRIYLSTVVSYQRSSSAKIVSSECCILISLFELLSSVPSKVSVHINFLATTLGIWLCYSQFVRKFTNE